MSKSRALYAEKVRVYIAARLTAKMRSSRKNIGGLPFASARPEAADCALSSKSA